VQIVEKSIYLDGIQIRTHLEQLGKFDVTLSCEKSPDNIDFLLFSVLCNRIKGVFEII